MSRHKELVDTRYEVVATLAEKEALEVKFLDALLKALEQYLGAPEGAFHIKDLKPFAAEAKVTSSKYVRDKDGHMVGGFRLTISRDEDAYELSVSLTPRGPDYEAACFGARRTLKATEDPGWEAFFDDILRNIKNDMRSPLARYATAET